MLSKCNSTVSDGNSGLKDSTNFTVSETAKILNRVGPMVIHYSDVFVVEPPSMCWTPFPIGNPLLSAAGTRSDDPTQRFTFEKAARLSIPNAGSLTGWFRFVPLEAFQQAQGPKTPRPITVHFKKSLSSSAFEVGMWYL